MPVILTTLEEINLQVFVSAPRRMTRHLKWQEFPNCDVTLPDREWPVNVNSSRPVCAKSGSSWSPDE